MFKNNNFLVKPKKVWKTKKNHKKHIIIKSSMIRKNHQNLKFKQIKFTLLANKKI